VISQAGHCFLASTAKYSPPGPPPMIVTFMVAP
jgi:hypothetical protein